MMKKVFWLMPFALLSAFAFFYVKYESRGKEAGAPNVLIISFCSLRLQDLPVFSEAGVDLPVLKKFFGESLVFKNAVNGLPWTNITNYVDVAWLKEQGFVNAKRKSLRIPAAPINKNTPQNAADHKFSFTEAKVRNYELHYREGFDKLKAQILNPLDKPFFVSAHIKYMHFPFIDSVNQKDLWKTAFTPASAAQLEKYLAAPARFPDKAALLLTLFADPDMVASSPYFKKYVPDPQAVRMGQLYQILSDGGLLGRWRKSEGYTQDLRILHEAYALKLKNLDRELADVLNMYGREDLRRDTVVIFTGDHGESLMEHNHFLHSNSVHENQIRFPLAVRPARRQLSAPVFIEEQTDMAMLGKLIQLAAEGDMQPAQVREVFASGGDNVYLRNCQGTAEGLRFKNDYMLVNDLEGQRLYDLKRDPAQVSDVKDANRELYFKMRERLFAVSSLPRNLFACDHPLDSANPLRPLWRVKADPDI